MELCVSTNVKRCVKTNPHIHEKDNRSIRDETLRYMPLFTWLATTTNSLNLSFERLLCANCLEI